MLPQSLHLKREERGQSVKVIIVGGLEAEFFGQDSPFEVHRCDEVSQVTRFWKGAETCVLLIDLGRLADGERAHLRKQIAQFNALRVLAVADSTDDKACESLLRMGCVGSLRGREAPATFTRAVKAVTAGELWFPRTVLSRVLRAFLAAQDPNRLTSRELQILELMGDDFNNQEIADKLFISRETVRWHIKGLHSKLGIPTRRGLRDHVRLLNHLSKANAGPARVGKKSPMPGGELSQPSASVSPNSGTFV